MAPSNISPGSAATVLSFLALAGLQLETRFRVGEVLAAPRPELSDGPDEPELPLALGPAAACWGRAPCSTCPVPTRATSSRCPRLAGSA